MALGPQPPIQFVPGLFSGGKITLSATLTPHRKYGAEVVKNEGNHISVSPTRRHSSHRGTHTFCL